VTLPGKLVIPVLIDETIDSIRMVKTVSDKDI